MSGRCNRKAGATINSGSQRPALQNIENHPDPNASDSFRTPVGLWTPKLLDEGATAVDAPIQKANNFRPRTRSAQSFPEEERNERERSTLSGLIQERSKQIELCRLKCKGFPDLDCRMSCPSKFQISRLD